MSMGRSCATAQKYAPHPASTLRFHSLPPPLPLPPLRHRQPHPSNHAVSRGFQHRSAHPERRPRRQHVIHQHHLHSCLSILGRSGHTLPVVLGSSHIHVGQSVLAGRAGGGRERGAVTDPSKEVRAKLTAPPRGQPLRHGLGRVEPATPPTTPMQWNRHEHAPGRRGSPPLGHPLAQGAALPRESPILHAVQHIERAVAQPKPDPKHLTSRTFTSQNFRRRVRRKSRPSPSARGTDPRHLVGHKRVATSPTPSQAPPPVHDRKLAEEDLRLRLDFIRDAAKFACVGRCRFGG